jgi:hypothetical protein
VKSRRWVSLLGLAATLPLAPNGCATCRSEAPPVEPSVSGRGSGGAGDFDQNARVDFEVSNLFCRAPKPEHDRSSTKTPDSESSPPR